MAAVARVLPRLWDGRRLLQFLTGLALIALAFVAAAAAGTAPAAEISEPPVTVITTVDTPAHGAMVDGDGPDVRIEDGNPAAIGVESPATGADDAAPAPGAALPNGLAAASTSESGRRICVEAAGRLDGIAARANGERAPPRI